MKLFLLTFAGFPVATLLLGFLGAAAVTTLLYILRLRRRRVGVAFLALWERSLAPRKASALRSRLQRLLSLLISLLIVGALILALGDPRLNDEENEGRSIAVLLDVSASMGETSGEGTRLDAAREKVKTWLSALGPGDEMLLIELGARPRPFAPATGDAEVLREALKEAEVLDVSADLKAGLGLAEDALRGRLHPQIILVSDGALPALDAKSFPNLPKFYFESVANKQEETSQNVGITSFSARRYPLSGDRFEVLVELKNDGIEPAEVELSLFEATQTGGRGAQLDLHRVTLPPEGSLAQSYSNLDHAETGLIAELRRVDSVPDPFSRDNVARTLLAERIPAKVLVVGKPDNFLDAALLLDESLEVKRVSADEYPPAGDYDVTIFNGVFPQRASRTGAALYLGIPAELDVPSEEGGYPLELGKELSLFGFDSWQKDSTVFRLIDPYNVQVLKGRTLVPQKSDVVLGASNAGPILVRGKRAEGDFLALGFSPRESDFVLRTVWPLFVQNVIDELYPRGRTDAVLGLRTGTLWRPPIPTSQSTVTVRGPLASANPSESTVPIDQGRAVFFGQRAGFYEAVSKEGVVRFSGSILSGAEGALPTAEEYRWGDKALPSAPSMQPRANRKPWFWLLLGVLAVSFSEWWLYHRRWTV